MSTSPSPPRFTLLILLAIISVIPLNMFVPSLPTIAEDYGVEYAVVNIAIGGYAVVMAVTQVIGGALSDRYGRRPVALGALGIFTLASVGCMLAPNVQLFLVFRMAQGVAAACQSVAMAAIRDSWEGPEVRQRVSNLSSAWAIGPMLGPTIGGILASTLGWRSNFVLFAVLGATGFVFVLTGFAETNKDRSTRLLQLEHYAAIVRSRIFWGYSVLMALSIGTLYVFLGGAPTVADELGNLSGSYVGLMLGLLPLGFMLSSAITARTSTRIPPHRIILVGRCLTVIGMITGLILVFVGANHPLGFFLPCMSIGLGNGLTIPSANAGVLGIAGKNAGAALGLASAITVTGAALLSFVSGFVIQNGHARESVLMSLLLTSIAALIVAFSIYRSMQHTTRTEPTTG